MFKEEKVKSQWPDLIDFQSSLKELAKLNPELSLDPSHDYEKFAKELNKVFNQISRPISNIQLAASLVFPHNSKEQKNQMIVVEAG